MFIDEEIEKRESEFIKNVLNISVSKSIEILGVLVKKIKEYNKEIKLGENDISKLINSGNGLKTMIVDKKDIEAIKLEFKINKIPVSYIENPENPNTYKCVYFKAHEDLVKNIGINKDNSLLHSIVNNGDVKGLSNFLKKNDVPHVFVKNKEIDNKSDCFIRGDQKENALKAFNEYKSSKTKDTDVGLAQEDYKFGHFGVENLAEEYEKPDLEQNNNLEQNIKLETTLPDINLEQVR